MLHFLLILIQINSLWNLKTILGQPKLFLIARDFSFECFYGPQLQYKVQNSSVGVRSATTIFLRRRWELEPKLKIF